MGLIDWLIVVIPVTFIIGMGFYSRRYIRGVADYLAAGRVCGRYVISVGNLANALSIIVLVGYIEVHYKTGFALAFWSVPISSLSIFMGLFGYCIYRFRETKAMSLGQFLEMRYNRSFRIFASALRSLSEMLANMIMPAIAARFFIYFLDLPENINLFGLMMPTFMVLIIVSLVLAIGLICMGGTLALIITDSIQGMLSFPLITIFAIFVLYKFNWSNEIIPVMVDRVPGESFLNPFDLSKLRDFNLFSLIALLAAMVFHRASWIGAGNSSAARNPHEQKMAGLLGAWRNSIVVVFYLLIAIAVITVMNHTNFATEAKNIRDDVSTKISKELIDDDSNRKLFNATITAIPEQHHNIGVDAPLSQDSNLDTPALDVAHKMLKEFEGNALGNAKFQQFRTLFHQMMVGSSMRQALPKGLIGLFCLLMVMAMISTDDTRIYSAALTLTQDVVMPLRKGEITSKQHVKMLRIVSIGVGVFFFCGSYFMAHIDYIQLFVTIMVSMWLGGCAPVMIFGLYSRFGTTAGAFTSLITGMILSLSGVFVQRNWAEHIYPWLERIDAVDLVGNFLATVSGPLNPYVVWEMNPVKFPINSYELYLMIMIITLFLYCGVSFFSRKEPFNLERMLHRGIYNIDGDKKERIHWSFGTFFHKLIGITGDYTIGDKAIAWSIFLYSFVFQVLIAFVGVLIWNSISPWPIEWWGRYFFIVFLVLPGIMAIISTFWFGIGSFRDLLRLFRDLKNRPDDPLDNGRVDGDVSVADKARFEKTEK